MASSASWVASACLRFMRSSPKEHVLAALDVQTRRGDIPSGTKTLVRLDNRAVALSTADLAVFIG